ncbi:Molybdopterin synthase catalytic subunit [Roseivivax jejudonensis]|uniref:Molybdopterin synthase catalytic subunit n=1 Tax=Roseivivax jejudonensis TaxID=1529041 RepID=A0A1X6YHD2_9RHOB|nr:molybdenum cofactor biosynthesis protein MoaE [Roseivivax jejudonensis]SLN21458.1 Molybdopterin synthase catalytic subunit [Roseivivax jejudonensis]
MRVVVQAAPFDYGAECADFARDRTDMGAVVTFAGIVRGDGGLASMDIEHYPGMTEKALTAIAEEAAQRWSLGDVLVIHRHGPLRPGERIMMVATAAPHRRDAFEAADFLMDYLKSRAPFWKKERGTEGENWVAAKVADEDALTRW